MDTFLSSLVQSHCGEEETLQTNNTGLCLQCLSHTGPAPGHSMCTLSAHTGQTLSCSTGNRPRPALGCMHIPGLSRSGSGTWVVLRCADLVGPAFCALSRSKQLRPPGVTASAVAAIYCLPCLCHSVFWVYYRRTFSGGCPPSRIPRSFG